MKTPVHQFKVQAVVGAASTYQNAGIVGHKTNRTSVHAAKAGDNVLGKVGHDLKELSVDRHARNKLL